MPEAAAARPGPPEDRAQGDWPERFVPGSMSGLIEAEHVARYAWAGQLAAGRRVLDAGCGVGYGAAALRRLGAGGVVGLDIADGAIAEALSRYGDEAEFVTGDLLNMPFEDGAFELVTCFEAIEHVDDQERALDELRRVLSPEGLLAISSPNREVYQTGNPHHTYEYTPDELEQALRERFAHVVLYRQQAWMASLIGDDLTHRAEDGFQELDAGLRKVAPGVPGQETFTLAIASRSATSAPRALALLTHTDELAAWQERALSAEQHVAMARDHADELQDAAARADALVDQARAERDASQRAAKASVKQVERERDDAARRNQGLSAELAEVREAERQLRTQIAETDQKLADVLASPSWRVTSPLRVVKRVWVVVRPRRRRR
jgi:O-antigen biosynthesis protein